MKDELLAALRIAFTNPIALAYIAFCVLFGAVGFIAFN